MGENVPMSGKKSEQGIVVKKLVRKATKISDFSLYWEGKH